MLPDELLDILACPVCKGSLHYRPDAQRLDCLPCGLGYPVKDGIPVLLSDQADVIQKPKSDVLCPG